MSINNTEHQDLTSSTTLDRAIFESCKTEGNGGAISISGLFFLNVFNSVFHLCEAGAEGGALFTSKTQTTLGCTEIKECLVAHTKDEVGGNAFTLEDYKLKGDDLTVSRCSDGKTSGNSVMQFCAGTLSMKNINTTLSYTFVYGDLLTYPGTNKGEMSFGHFQGNQATTLFYKEAVLKIDTLNVIKNKLSTSIFYLINCKVWNSCFFGNGCTLTRGNQVFVNCIGDINDERITNGTTTTRRIELMETCSVTWVFTKKKGLSNAR